VPVTFRMFLGHLTSTYDGFQVPMLVISGSEAAAGYGFTQS
jgi:hypothetical protein